MCSDAADLGGVHLPAPLPSKTARPLPAGVPCYQCEYELAGLVPGGVCPECGLAISASWPRPRVVSEARRLAERARGRIQLVLATTIMLFIVNASLVLSAFGALIYAVGQRSQATIEDGEGAMLIGMFLAFLAMLAYAVLATILAAIPHFHGERKRFGVRVGGPLMAAGMVACVLGMPLFSPLLTMGGLLAVVVGNIACVVAMLGICGDPLDQAGRSRPAVWIVVVLVSAFVVLPIVAAVAALSGVVGACLTLGAVLLMTGASAILVWQAIRGVRAVEFEIGQAGQPTTY